MKRFFFISSWVYIFFASCQTWIDKDLTIPEVFINERKEVFLIIKNQGHSPISEKDIFLSVLVNGQNYKIALDTIDPHFRNPRDSSILKLPLLIDSTDIQISAQVDITNVLTESDEEHNGYYKTLSIDSIPTFTQSYPIARSAFDAKMYTDLIESIPFANQVIWQEKSRMYLLSFWKQNWKDSLLQKIKSEHSLFTITPTDSFKTSFSRDQAFDIFTNYIAHALIIEREKLVPWSVKEINAPDLSYLWDSRNFFRYDSLSDLYLLDYELGGAIQLDRPNSSFLIGYTCLLNADQEKSINNILNWSRDQMVHTEDPSLKMYQRSLDIWFPMNEKIHGIRSCWASGGAIVDICRSLNIPIKKTSIELHNGKHASLYFPSLRKHLMHVDDLYEPLFQITIPGFNANHLLIDQDAFIKLLNTNKYCTNTRCHTKGEQLTFERRKWIIDKAIAEQTPVLKIMQKENNNNVLALLRGDDYPNLLKPIYDSSDQGTILKNIQSWPLEKNKIVALHQRFYAAKNNRR